ncbi:MAG: type IV secretion system protein, partial [Bacteroidota bacterium]
VSGVVPAYVYFDKLIENALNNQLITDNQELITFFALIGLIYWPVMMLAAAWLMATFLIFMRTLISFVLCITAITFLITLSPIFFCMMLFKSTMQFFETWLKFMISFSMQVLIVFAIVALWILSMLNFIGFFDQLSKVIFLDLSQPRISSVTSKEESIGICPYKIELYSGDYVGQKIFGPNIYCAKENFNPYDRVKSGPKKGELTQQAAKDLNSLIRITNVAPPQNAGDCKVDPNCEYGNEVGVSNPTYRRLAPLIYFTIYHLIMLTLVAYAFDALLRQAPMIAQQLAGPQYVPKLGQGFGGLGYNRIPGVSRMRENTSGGNSMVGSAVRNILGDSGSMAG